MSSSSPSPPRSPLIHLLLLLALFPGFLVVLADRGWPRPLRGVSPEGYEVINVSTTAGDAVPNCGGDGDAVCVPDVCDNAQAMLHGRLAPGSTQIVWQSGTVRARNLHWSAFFLAHPKARLVLETSPDDVLGGRWTPVDSANGVGYDAWVDFSCCDEERYFFNQRRGLDDKKEGEDQVMRAGEDDKPGSRRSPAALFRYVESVTDSLVRANGLHPISSPLFSSAFSYLFARPYKVVDFRDVPRHEDLDVPDAPKKKKTKAKTSAEVEEQEEEEEEKEEKEDAAEESKKENVRDAGAGETSPGAVCHLRGWSVALPEQGSDFSSSGYCAHAVAG